MLTPDDVRSYIDDPNCRPEVNVIDLVEFLLERLHVAQAVHGTSISILSHTACGQAHAAQKRLERGESGPLLGLPIVIKDNIDIKDAVTTVGTPYFRERVAQRDAFVVQRLRASGVVILAKAHLHELLCGVTSEAPTYGQCVNAWDPDRIAGGSSGGSAVAVALDLCAGALGSDTGGSIRIPAALNGVSGFRPSFGRLSTSGVYPLAPLFDVVGPMARSVRDLTEMFIAADADDARDPLQFPYRRLRRIPAQTGRALRVGILEREWMCGGGGGPPVLNRIREALTAVGMICRPLEVPPLSQIRQPFLDLLDASTFATNQQILASAPQLLSEHIRERMEQGAAMPAARLLDAFTALTRWRAAISRLTERFDILAMPTTTITAPPRNSPFEAHTPAQLSDYTYPWSLAGMPCLTVPAGLASDGLPVGLQFVGANGRDGLLLHLGMALQEITTWHRQRPSTHPHTATPGGHHKAPRKAG